MGDTQGKHQVQPVKAGKVGGGRDLEALGLAEGLAHCGGEGRWWERLGGSRGLG